MARIPKYRRHSSGLFALVEIHGRRHRLPGPYGSAESRRAYHRIVARLLQDAEPIVAGRPADGLKIAMLVERYLPWAADYYGGNAEYGCLYDATRPLVAMHGLTSVERFGPQDLAAVREAMIAGRWPAGEFECILPRPWSRTYINHQIHRLLRIFRWGVEHQFVPPAVLAGLRSLMPLRKGKTSARETEPVRPVEPADVEAVLPLLCPQVRAMVKLQRLTGARSDNVCSMRLADIDRSGDVWAYVPAQHKSAWRDRGLCIWLGPRCQAILGPFLARPPETYLFSPREAADWRRADRRARRQTPLTPSQAARKPKPRRKRPLGDRYTTASYRRAVRYACRLAKIPAWHPHQLRHNVGTEVRRRFGLEASRAFLGHASANVTEIYAELDAASARAIAREIG